MSEYLSVLKQSMREAIRLAKEPQTSISGFDCVQSLKYVQSLKKYVQDCNQRILEEYLLNYPHSSPTETINFYLQNYKYQRLKCEGNSALKINVIFENQILHFSKITEYYSSLFTFPDDLNTLLFRMIIVLNSCQAATEEFIRCSPKKFKLEDYGVSRNSASFLLRDYLIDISNGDMAFSNKYGRKSSIDLIYRQIIRTMGKATYAHFTKNRSAYKDIPVKNILTLLMDAIVTEKEAAIDSSRIIKRHPAWCYYNMIGHGKCIEFNTECHSTIGCPFFKKALRTPSGAIKIDDSYL